MKSHKIIHLDPLLSIGFTLLITIGLLVLASASMPLAEKDYGTSFYFFYNQVTCLALGLVILTGILLTPSIIWQKLADPLLFLSLFLLFLVLVFGTEVNGARRWLAFPGFKLQVSEVFKFTLVVYMANFLKTYSKEIRNNIKILLLPVIVVGIASVLLLNEPDFGATVVILLTFTTMVFLSGVPLRPLILLVLIALLALSCLAVFTPYRLVRLTTFLHPWESPYSSGYQLTQALISYGRGDFFGLGLGGSIQKLFYLPEAHTDFIFAILAEELGLVGAIAIITLYLVVIIRIFYYGMKAQNKNMHWQAYILYGTAIYIAGQAFIGVGVNLGVLPTKGLTLPFLSYGRSSLIINCAFIGLVLRSIAEIENQAKLNKYNITLWR